MEPIGEGSETWRAARPRPVRRLVAGQGPIQLVAALTAMGTHARRTHDAATPFEDRLLVFNLHAPPEREAAFAAAIRAMAEAASPWRAVVHLDAATVDGLAETCRARGAAAAIRRVHELIGVDRADELYLIRSWPFANELLLNAYPGARKICFGDGIGLHYGHSYLTGSPALAGSAWPERARRAARSLRARIGGVLRRRRRLRPIGFDLAYLALPGILGDAPPMETVRVERAALLASLRRVAGGLDTRPVAALGARLRDRPTTLLVTSNFSEARRMEPDQEIRAYRAFFAAHRPARGAVAVVKPHPREGTAKLAALRSALTPPFDEVIVLEEGLLAFAPFELVLLEGGFLRPDLGLREHVEVVTLSNACLSLALLFGIRPTMAFGADLVRACFRPTFVEARLRWEADMAGGVERILAEAGARPAPHGG